MNQLGIILLAIWITLGSFMPLNDIEELAKIPNLYAHFQEHKVHHNNQLSFMDFMSEHYSTKNCEDKDHKKLPFFEHQISGLVFLIPTFSIELIHTFEFILKVYSPESQSDIITISQSVWQPPRLA